MALLRRCGRSSNRSIALLILLLIGAALLFFSTRLTPTQRQVASEESKNRLMTESIDYLEEKEIDFTRNKWQDAIDFEGFNNQTGADHLIVPNIIHYVRFNQPEYSFTDYLCLQAAYRHHRPDYFYIHTDVGHKFTGKYWDWIQKEDDLRSRIRLIHQPMPSEIFGQPFRYEWRFQHASDVTRIRVLMEHGGIYLDNDVFLIKSLDKYRKYEIAMNWDEDQFLGNQIFVTHKNARFLKLYLESYRDNYRQNEWYYNAGERPTREILFHHPELLHRVKIQFGADTGLSMRLYMDSRFNWRNLDAIHLLMNHRYYLDPHYKEIPVFDETNIKTYQYPFGDMAREIMEDIEKEPWFIN